MATSRIMALVPFTNTRSWIPILPILVVSLTLTPSMLSNLTSHFQPLGGSSYLVWAWGQPPTTWVRFSNPSFLHSRHCSSLSYLFLSLISLGVFVRCWMAMILPDSWILAGIWRVSQLLLTLSALTSSLKWFSVSTISGTLCPSMLTCL